MMLLVTPAGCSEGQKMTYAFPIPYLLFLEPVHFTGDLLLSQTTLCSVTMQAFAHRAE